MSEFFREVPQGAQNRWTEFVVRAGDLENGWPNDILMGICSVDNGHARSLYAKRDGLMRLAAKVGIDSYVDGCAFSDWWGAHGAACQRVWATFVGWGSEPIGFADFAREAFLCWLEPIAEDDAAMAEEYNDNYPQEWMVMGEERSARVTMRWRVRDEKEENFFPMRLEYVAGDYPTYRKFDTFEELNREILQWTGS